MLQVERHNDEVQQAELPLIHSSRATISSGGIHRLRRKGNLALSQARIEVSLGKTIIISRKQHLYS